MDGDALERIDRSLRLGSSPAPTGLPEFRLHDEALGYEALSAGTKMPAERTRQGMRHHRIVAENRAIFMEQMLSGEAGGRASDSQVTYSERGNIQGAQFFAVAGRAYELAKAKGLGNSVPIEWLTQDIRD